MHRRMVEGSYICYLTLDENTPCYDPIVPQNGEKFSISVASASGETQQQNVSFKDMNASYDYSILSNPDDTHYSSVTNDSDLGNFFSRPIKVFTISWGTGLTLYNVFNPWTTYFSNPRVINRISNFNLLRCKLCLKFVINGNQFLYGRAICDYNPLFLQDEFTVNRSFFTQDLIAMSQKPHIYLDPCTSAGGTMTLPMLWEKNTMSIPNQDWNSMGECTLRSINALKHANGASEAITISVFAWAEDVCLSIPTSAEPGALSPQAGMKDEYGSGPVSKPASIVARASGALSNAPTIGPYMRATSMAASTIASIARSFGYSRPITLGPTGRTSIKPVGNIANTNMEDSSTKLSLDVKQELTIDPRTVGLSSTDEMSVRSIAMRESYITSFSWDTTHLAEALLWNGRVTPMYYDNTGPGAIHFTPAAHVTLPFEYWRGSMEFRFQVVSSNFHKGRLAISYDPYYPVTLEYNTAYTHVIDASECKDFTIKVGWGNPLAFLQVTKPHLVGSFPFSTSAFSSALDTACNGVISVRVLNALTVPNTTVNNDIKINVFVKMCDDFDVAGPTDEYSNYVWEPNVVPQSGSKPMDAEMSDEPNAPISLETEAVMAPVLDSSDDIFSVHFGEQITSVRQLLKRYCFYGVHAPLTGAMYAKLVKTDFPLHRGYSLGGVHITSAGDGYNYFRTTTMSFFSPCFAMARGGLRWKYHRITSVATTPSLLLARRETDGASGYALTSSTGWPGLSSLSTQNKTANPLFGDTFIGAAETNATVDPCVELELPFYSNKRFASSRYKDPNARTDWGKHSVQSSWNTTALTSPNSTTIRELVSTGEDFCLFMYMGVPPMYYVPVDPA